MKRRKFDSTKELVDLGDNLGGHLGHHVKKHSLQDEVHFNDEVLQEIPEEMALPLGRHEGFSMSDMEKGLLQDVIEAFDRGALNILSPMQRSCFTDIIISGDSYTMVAKRYGVARSTVQRHVEAAGKRIRKVIDEQ